MTVEERKKVMENFILATLEAVPGARRNSMNAGVRPAYVLGTIKDKGQPIQLVNAFEKPMWSGKDGTILERSIAELKAQHTALKSTWAIAPTEEVAIPDLNITEFLQRLTAHVP
jgi:CRISPR system Cascade subunit CasC